MGKEEKSVYTIKTEENLGEVKIADEVVAVIAFGTSMSVFSIHLICSYGRLSIRISTLYSFSRRNFSTSNWSTPTGMDVYHMQGGKKVRLSQPQQMMASERHMVHRGELSSAYQLLVKLCSRAVLQLDLLLKARPLHVAYKSVKLWRAQRDFLHFPLYRPLSRVREQFHFPFLPVVDSSELLPAPDRPIDRACSDPKEESSPRYFLALLLRTSAWRRSFGTFLP